MKTRLYGQLRKVILSAIAGLILPTPGFSQSPSSNDFPPSGRMIDIGGYRLHINCSGGAKKGTPTVILLHGLSGYSFDWALVQPEVARFTRVCSYDRAGQAWSDPGPQPRGLKTITTELHTLLQNAGENGPYILVGHSWGGLIPRMYASLYPSEVVGIVFVDSTNEEDNLWVQGKTVYPFFMNPKDWQEQASRNYRDAGAPPPGSGIVIKKKSEDKSEPPFDKLPPEIQRMRLWARSKPRDARIAAGGDWGDIRADLKLVASTNRDWEYPLRDLPVIAISGTQYEYTKDDAEAGFSSAEEKWRDKFRWDVHLARLSQNSKTIVAKKSGHHIHIDEPALVINAVREVFEAIRHHSRLKPPNQNHADFLF
jgi:pimeloyl-ACP methyl ester carboxylesterase